MPPAAISAQTKRINELEAALERVRLACKCADIRAVTAINSGRPWPYAAGHEAVSTFVQEVQTAMEVAS